MSGGAGWEWRQREYDQADPAKLRVNPVAPPVLRDCRTCGETYPKDFLTDGECDVCYAERTDWDGTHGQD